MEALSRCCKATHALVNDPIVWQGMYHNVFGWKPSPLSFTSSKWPELFKRRARSKLYAWGKPDSGRLGTATRNIPPEYARRAGFTTAVVRPFPINAFSHVVLADVTAGGFSFQILTSNGEIYSTGSSWNGGQVGPGPDSYDFQTRPGVSLPIRGGATRNNAGGNATRVAPEDSTDANPDALTFGPLFPGNPFPMGRVGGVIHANHGHPVPTPIDAPTDVSADAPTSTSPDALTFGPLFPGTPFPMGRVGGVIHANHGHPVPTPTDAPTDVSVDAPTSTSLGGLTLGPLFPGTPFPMGRIGGVIRDFLGPPQPSTAAPSSRVTGLPATATSPIVTATPISDVPMPQPGGRPEPPTTTQAPPSVPKVETQEGVVSLMKTPVPVEFIALSSGRCHFIALDSKGSIWSWDHPAQRMGIRLHFDQLSSGNAILKIAAGWNISTAYVLNVGIIVWHKRDAVPKLDKAYPVEHTARAHYKVIRGTGAVRGDARVVDFVACDGFVVFITGKGELYRVDVGNPELVERIRPVLLSEFMARLEEGSRFVRLSGSFRNFAAISSDDQVLIGNRETTEPQIIPELQKRNFISIAVGDYHYLGLLKNGTLLSWGRESNSCGCLGLGVPEEVFRNGGSLHESSVTVHKPLEVDLGGKKAVAIAAGGWQSCAIVADV
ncbi:hypothetical protein BABINDRAFT_159525 [Babjeviella inositovora NRRL Y-12698]|uniref:Regulator of chromosome condensation 1/beta-lactamase-inhibitor protein II n=1 Tax=Babjeviella inositovora NRRL Y-12698 TaxID=984486 RepID=A0A1E3QZF8_9ASCO|nr:uncharacterized protein BABINDRAFT_159525 [Babjeviella inositovora NRRL Y-12698]ODQ83063.1 hypothetical protein BABINDRAFT_159525 [Babjeviella inositovora NRRL Y-12698]